MVFGSRETRTKYHISCPTTLILRGLGFLLQFVRKSRMLMFQLIKRPNYSIIFSRKMV